MAGKRGKVLFKETEIARCFRAAKTAGISIKVNIGADGSLSLVPVETPNQGDLAATKTAPTLRSWD
jgi:hypothetical protein